ncbi:MAG: methyltransferase domain-containing protein [Nitrospirota bacterium]
MTEFNKTRWADNEFAKEYRDNADIFIVERQRMIGIMASFYRYFISGNNKKELLDLGCGDGILIERILEIDGNVSATLVDASDDMLVKAKERLKDYKNIDYIRASFQEVMGQDIIRSSFDFIVSSLAIHHLTTDEKMLFFNKIHSHLHKGGYFLNIDVILPPTDTLEQWYLQMWNEWMEEQKKQFNIDRDLFKDVTRRYKAYDENKPDTLDSQLNALRDIGFVEVDCYYKYGVFAVYGGKRVSTAVIPEVL